MVTLLSEVYMDNESKVKRYSVNGILGKDDARIALELDGVFDKCGCVHDCCGHWNAHYMDVIRYERNTTIVNVWFYQNV